MVVGFDRAINYHKIQYATLCISENPGCHFIATNLDAKTHLTDAQEWAGNGSMVGAIKGKLCAPAAWPCAAVLSNAGLWSVHQERQKSVHLRILVLSQSHCWFRSVTSRMKGS